MFYAASDIRSCPLIRIGSKTSPSADSFFAQERILLRNRCQWEIGCNTMKGLQGNRLLSALFVARGTWFWSNVSMLFVKIKAAGNGGLFMIMTDTHPERFFIKSSSSMEKFV
jgi:hypothetical protein